MLENGARVSQISHFIQVDRKQYLHVPIESLETLIYYWLRKNRDRSNLQDRSPSGHVTLIGSADRIDPLDAVHMLFAIQMDRIAEHYKAERTSKVFTTFNNSAIRLANELVRTMMDIEGKRRPKAGSNTDPKGVGEVMKQTERIQEIYAQRYGQQTAKVALNDHSRRKVMNAIERVRKGQSDSLQKILAANEEQAAKLRAEEEEQSRIDASEELHDADGKVTTS